MKRLLSFRIFSMSSSLIFEPSDALWSYEARRTVHRLDAVESRFLVNKHERKIERARRKRRMRSRTGALRDDRMVN